MNKRILWIILAILFFIALLVIVFVLLFGNFLQSRSLNSRPLVSIQDPLDQAWLETGKGLIVHTSAYASQGVSEIELWVDNLLVATRVSPEGILTSNLILSTNWTPLQSGPHTLIVRAISRDGVEGQASIQVQAVDAYPDGLSRHIVQEGETLESIADSYGTTPQELASLNGRPGSPAPLPGDEIIVPPAGGEASPFPEETGTEESSGSMEDVPAADAPPPGSMESLNILWPAIPFHLPAEPVQLKVEVLTLETLDSYESLHCYVSLATNSPRWVPDADGDQSTDESFEPTHSGHTWEIAGHMAEDQAVRLFWEGNQPIPLDISCVGITDLGTDAVSLGRVIEEAAPESWGILQHATSSGGEGTFQITYQINSAEKGPDESIMPPWNVRLDEVRHILLWDYLPNEGSQPVVDGFAIFLNDTLQWVETGSKRQARLPEQWFILPCGDEYRFHVIAFNNGYPDGNYSLPSNSASILGGVIGSPECTRSVVITFEQLTTGDLPGNPSPVYGSFFANDLALNFDGRPIAGDSFPTTFGLQKNSEYIIGQVLNGFGQGETQLVVEIPPGNASVSEYPLWVGFDIYKGGNKVCSGDVAISEESLAGAYRGTVNTDHPVGYLPDWCVVSFSLAPLGETPVVDPGSPPPLANINIENLSVDPSSGRMRIHIRNVGQASWVEKDIVARVTWPDGEEIGVFSWPNMTLLPGQTAILSHGGLNHQPALGACVLLDPENAVQEERDRLVEAGIIAEKAPYCRPLPDLSINNVSWDPVASQMNITLENRGEVTASSTDSDGSLDHANLVFWINLADGRPLTTVFNNLDMRAHETTVLTWALGATERERMSSGYTLQVNPEESIAELDTSNNTYLVEGSARLRLVWMVAYATFCPTNNVLLRGENVSGRNNWTMQLDAQVGSGSSQRSIANWSSSEIEIPWTEPSGARWCAGDQPFISDWFDVSGDEALNVSLTADLDIFGHGYRWFSGGSEALSAADDFGGTTHVPATVSDQCYLAGPPFYSDTGPFVTSQGGGCGYLACSNLSEMGHHQLGMVEARSDDITGYCWWSTTYTIYRQEEGAGP